MALGSSILGSKPKVGMSGPTMATAGPYTPPVNPMGPAKTSTGADFVSQAQIKTAANPGQEAFYNALPKYYGGNTVAGMNQDQLNAQGQVRSTANQQQAVIGDYLTKLNNPVVNPYFSTAVGTDPRLNSALDFSLGDILREGNPYAKAAMDSATRQITDNFTQSVLPQLGSEAQRSGAWGGSRQGIVEGLAAGETAKAVGDTAANLAAKNYETSLNTFNNGMNIASGLRAQDITQRGITSQEGQSSMQRKLDEFLGKGALLPSIIDTGYKPAQMLDAIGTDNRAYDQQLIDADVAKHNYGQNADADRLALYSGLLSGQGTAGISAGGGSTQTTKTPKSSALQNAIGGASAGAALGSMTNFDNGGTWGAVLGALAGLLDD